jgi:hypothetical protein
VASQIQNGPVHLSADSLKKAQEFLTSCGETLSFGVEAFSDGCQLISLIENASESLG